MKVGNIKKLCFPLLNPSFTIYRLTLWTMSISATIIADFDFATRSTLLLMSAQLFGSADFYSMKSSEYLSTYVVLCQKLLFVLMQYLCYLIPRSQRSLL